MKDNDAENGSPGIAAWCKVCAKRVSPDEQSHKVYYGGMAFVVCCPSCASKFRESPKEYIVTRYGQ